MEHHGVNLLITVQSLETADLHLLAGDEIDPELEPQTDAEFGQLLNATTVDLGSGNPAIRIEGSAKARRSKQIFVTGFNFSDMGIGGLDEQFSQIFRRAFASRIFPSAVVQKLGINHVRGILLHGPPGTGKTLIARQIGKMLQAREPKVVNGPEILNKYVGQSEENIRNLFKDAEAEYHERGEDSDLHIIIFDEIDAICKQRGTAGGSTGVHDTVVNQLLSKMDGVDSLNNILVIGMTNRKGMYWSTHTHTHTQRRRERVREREREKERESMSTYHLWHLPPCYQHHGHWYFARYVSHRRQCVSYQYQCEQYHQPYARQCSPWPEV
eukprot:TRINITY_DN1447_c0_g2_i2.p1 TRINITY_DN1447_c0_g2~~TRINITY_DN1447_c0_g2_i2.p1  ORF type:complete len:326 (+),score=69.20 TRINITY_DN1447_c0_g2_i2:824-1801(+)